MTLRLPKALLKTHHVHVARDSPYQQRVRLLQALWREERELPVGLHRDRPLGSRLRMPDAQEGLSNYLTDTIRDVVRTEVDGPKRKGKLYGKPRIYDDLLSSQPLCFNLFAELQQDLELATKALALLDRRVGRVTAVQFEWSPGRRDPKFTGDRSAFDVFVEYESAEARRGFLGIEVKYHENLADQAAEHRARYDEVAAEAECFEPDALGRLREKPLQQIWRDHLLACSMLTGAGRRYDEGRFVFLAPGSNDRCAAAVEQYARCLSNRDTFAAWTLEEVVESIRAAGAGSWIDEVKRRYLDFSRIDGAAPLQS